LARLLDDADLRRALGDSGLRRARVEFSVERMAERTMRVYEDALRP
jgi:glycosyltransferase involved in cell wall biosynthesis